jgi:putative transposase
MIEVRTESHYVYKIRFYTVFDIKYGRRLLQDDNPINYIKSGYSEIGKIHGLDFDAIRTDGDHVHVFVGATSSAPQQMS